MSTGMRLSVLSGFPEVLTPADCAAAAGVSEQVIIHAFETRSLVGVYGGSAEAGWRTHRDCFEDWKRRNHMMLTVAALVGQG